jgi:DNA-binding sugar fermentation-stimulating protein
MEGVKMVYPNAAMDKEFAEAFYEAQAAGVKVLNLACRVEKDELEVL